VRRAKDSVLALQKLKGWGSVAAGLGPRVVSVGSLMGRLFFGYRGEVRKIRDSEVGGDGPDRGVTTGRHQHTSHALLIAWRRRSTSDLRDTPQTTH
jgi:hypothetical protein